MTPAPTHAPAWATPGATRTDLPFLRHRARPRPEPTPEPEPTIERGAVASAPASPLSLDGPAGLDLASPSAPAAPLSLDAPGGLDLAPPDAVASRPSAPASPSAPAAPLSLDGPGAPLSLDGPGAPLSLDGPGAPLSLDGPAALDLSRPDATPAAPFATVTPPPAERNLVHHAAPDSVRNVAVGGGGAPATRHRALPPLLRGFPGVRGAERRVLTPDAPVVMLDRVQSGVGPLRVALASSTPMGMAVAYELDGHEGLLRGPVGGYAPSHHRPVVSLSGTTLDVDLGHVRGLSRFLVMLRAVTFDGTLVVTTLGGARIEVPLAHDGDPGEDLVALSGYVVRGALTLRAEMDVQDDGLRGATAAYGYDEITWRDRDTPVR
ncbi:hypothetical protein CLV28_3001 [Sediminihabitans luteus]|uniref:Uncharacterized protein n=1 Tax=Sediminihabitans luteus TaxID=1138585 RepID=A0A2M9CC11_9CELL|nr:hypothetical protein [Sediminihabitans luteus]PJJ68585.1 hypothetical protein CLV28_3001 [Sediminihabitans luteus]GII99923.1 hypothetical protein Slu03_23010 [Sediminihabitans luteus]